MKRRTVSNKLPTGTSLPQFTPTVRVSEMPYHIQREAKKVKVTAQFCFECAVHILQYNVYLRFC